MIKTTKISCRLHNRVRTGPRKPGKFWNLIVAFSRTGNSWKKAIDPGKFWKSVKLTDVADNKEN